jgi:riboflavin kinase/FMN adenylyltransferase
VFWNLEGIMSDPVSYSSPSRRPFLLHKKPVALPDALARPIVVIGNFDGLHRGHRAVIEAGRRLAVEQNRPLAVLTFDPHPRSYFRPEEPVFRLTPDPLKAAILGHWGVDGLIILPFNEEMAATSAKTFVDDLLFRQINASGVAIGHDFHFGKGREGSPGFIHEHAATLGRSSVIVPPLTAFDEPVSSTAIRAALAEGDVPHANHLLGYRYLFQAEVRHGEKIGRTLGFPTANLRLPSENGLMEGIYAVRVEVDGVVHNGVASYGRRPTFDNGAPLFEIWLMDFTGDLYGKTLNVECVKRQRGELKFDSVDGLVEQMHRDAAEARAILAEPIGADAPSLLPL